MLLHVKSNDKFSTRDKLNVRHLGTRQQSSHMGFVDSFVRKTFVSAYQRYDRQSSEIK